MGNREVLCLEQVRLHCPPVSLRPFSSNRPPRSRGRGRKQEVVEALEGGAVTEGNSTAIDVPQQSDDVRTADMEMSDEGETDLTNDFMYR